MEQLITYEPATYKDKDVIFIRFDYSRELNRRIGTLTGVRWSQSKKAWYVPKTLHYRQQFGLAPPLAGKDVISHIHPMKK